MKKYFFIYERIGKKQTLRLWGIVEAKNYESASEEGKRTFFFGDFKYVHIATIME